MAASRRLYIELAKTLHIFKRVIDEKTFLDLTSLIASDLAQDGIRFDRTKFLKACGIDD